MKTILQWCRRFPVPCVIAGYLALACAITFPGILHLHSRVIGLSDHPTFQGEIFFLHAIREGVSGGHLLDWFRTDLVRFPFGLDFGPSVAHSLHLYLSLLFGFWPDLPAVYNCMVILLFCLNGMAMYALARELFPSRSVPFAAGVFYLLNTYALLKISMGSLHKLSFFWLPLFALFLFRLGAAGKPKDLALSLLFLLLAYWTYPLYAYYLLLAVALLAAGRAIVERDRSSLSFLKNCLLLFALFATVNLAADLLLRFRGVVRDMSFMKDFNFPATGYFDLLHPFRTMLPTPTALPVGFSVVAVLLACAALAAGKGKMPRYLFAGAAVFAVIAAGPYLHAGGYLVPLPYYFLYRFTPSVYGEGLVFPLRALPIANLCLALLAGYAMTVIAEKGLRRRYLLAAGLCLALYAGELAIRFPELLPVQSSPLPHAALVEALRAGGSGAVLNVPVREDRRTANYYCYLSAVSGRKMVNAYDDTPASLLVPSGESGDEAHRSFIDQLARWGVGSIVVHKGLLKEQGGTAEGMQWLERYCGSPLSLAQDDVLLYRVPAREESFGHTLRVPSSFTTIQAAIDAAAAGDLVLVAPGTYRENIDFRGKAVTVRGSGGARVTVIQGADNASSVVSFRSGEGPGSVLEGFTITGGIGLSIAGDDERAEVRRNGGGICCDGASPRIFSNIIRANRAENGGGICCVNRSSPLVAGNLIEDNTAVKGGGIRCSISSSPTIEHNIIRGNHAKRLGGGVYWRLGSRPLLRGDQIMFNRAGTDGGGIFGSSHVANEWLAPVASNESIRVNDCVIRENSAPNGPAIRMGYSPWKVILTRTKVEGDVHDPSGTLLVQEAQ